MFFPELLCFRYLFLPETCNIALFSYLDNIAAVYLIKHCKCAKLHFNYRATG